jgi:hypothetical protein
MWPAAPEARVQRPRASNSLQTFGLINLTRLLVTVQSMCNERQSLLGRNRAITRARTLARPRQAALSLDRAEMFGIMDQHTLTSPQSQKTGFEVRENKRRPTASLERTADRNRASLTITISPFRNCDANRTPAAWFCVCRYRPLRRPLLSACRTARLGPAAGTPASGPTEPSTRRPLCALHEGARGRTVVRGHWPSHVYLT